MFDLNLKLKFPSLPKEDNFKIKVDSLMGVCVPIRTYTTTIPLEKFIKKDWQDFPRKKKKIVKKLMQEINELNDKMILDLF